MKFTALAIATLLVGATTAHAQSAPAYYAGIAYSSFGGENDYIDYDAQYDLIGDVAEVFFGIDYEMNGYILGGELALTTDAVYEDGYEDEWEYTSIVDLKGRVGYQVGSFLPYGVMGLSVSEFYDDGDKTTQSGLIVGIGTEYSINEQFKVGVEFARRSYDFAADGSDLEGTVDSGSLRAAYTF
ncbi:outer membrane beta-barrel protein [Yoonia sp. I 8.24]|uniref:outer membrane beta-barrel protein n=1 Tax=Yoonia sp. I 8.24 TaxID=1537229 RepID=UPI001EE14BAA|nr:outer membrane beta-barrel protein [Yoonia sp. I 8.24]MCG3268781.1 outer membrane beta-barrel protein [Yoonia sp. I 8.24]